MNKIVELLHDPVWWFSGVILALVLNVTSSFVRDWIDRVFSAHAAKRRAVRLENSERLRGIVAEIRSSPDIELLYVATETSLARKATELWFSALVCLGIATYSSLRPLSWLFATMAAVGFLMSFYHGRRRHFIRDALGAANSVYVRWGA